MPKHRNYYTPVPAEQLFQNAPAAGRDVDIANFYLNRVSEVTRDNLADLLAAYRIEQEDKLEERIDELQSEVDRLKEDFEVYIE